MSNISCPAWASKITADVCSNHIPELEQDLRPYHGQPLSVVWDRLTVTVKKQLTKWWDTP